MPDRGRPLPRLREHAPHLSAGEARAMADALNGEAPDAKTATGEAGNGPDAARLADARRRDLMTRLAWRPAWSIRSRRGALAALLALFAGDCG